MADGDGYDGLRKSVFFLSEGPKNWAESAEVRERIKSELMPVVRDVISRRVPLTQYWASLFRLWSLEHEVQGYMGRSNLYIPAARKIIDRLVAALMSMCFPLDEPFNVAAHEDEWAGTAEDVKHLMMYRVKQAHVRANASPFFLWLLIAGTSPVKVHWYEKTTKRLKRAKNVANAKSEASLLGGWKETENKIYCGPMMDCVHPGNFFVFPENITDIKDATMVIETLRRTREYIRAQVAKGVYVEEEADAVQAGEKIDNMTIVDANNLKGQGLSPVDLAEKKTQGGAVDCYEFWCDWNPTGIDGEIVPMRFIVSSSDHVLLAEENPYAHKRPPYLVGRMGKATGRFYGSGLAEVIQSLQQLLNDQTNQGVDAATLAINPYGLYNPNLVKGGFTDLSPGALMPVDDIDRAIKWQSPPVELIQASSVITAQTQSWLQDFGAGGPVMMGGAAPGRAFKTAAGVQTAQRNATEPLQELARSVEEDVFEQLLYMFFDLDQQFGTDEVLFEAGGKKMRRLNPAQIAGDYAFSWQASQQASSMAVKGQQIQQLLQLMMNPQAAQAAQANGIKFNIVPLVKKMYVEVMGFRNSEEVLVPMQPGEQPPVPPPEPSAPLIQPPADYSGSLAGPLPGMEDDEGFGGVRAEANQLAGILGADNTPSINEG